MDVNYLKSYFLIILLTFILGNLFFFVLYFSNKYFKIKRKSCIKKIRDLTDEDDPRKCVLCSSRPGNPVLTLCGHTYCLNCYNVYFKNTGDTYYCISCRDFLHVNDFIPFYPGSFDTNDILREEKRPIINNILEENQKELIRRRSLLLGYVIDKYNRIPLKIAVPNQNDHNYFKKYQLYLVIGSVFMCFVYFVYHKK
ncbi:RING-finger-containing E3 ubiquitin ligase [Tubulinosema ratisbonensis]|uniref:RING-finger-containing E3 ubiquitin ligase n=1 Tax=Tubulinosema ratisbonensis TaxID=291195 RepID=A0A437AMU0_9MICR|nr:RING-finger-containing E3 ubiquitin ligase [Tubulinosema ratisbonensis]